jgi:hypothetical protein
VLAAIIAVGLLSRATQTGSILIDKYLGDALYAAMIYALFRLGGLRQHVAAATAITMLAIELFQLTGIPATMAQNESLLLRVCARLLGTHFSLLDLLAYTAGIACIASADACRRT